jgi:hypothetical protein
MTDKPKIKVLTRLKINEISMVDRGAGENCRILISKRDDSADADHVDLSPAEIARAKVEGYQALRHAEERFLKEHGTGHADHEPEDARFLFSKETFVRKSAAATARGVDGGVQSRISKSTSQDSTMTNIDMSAIVKAYGVALFKYIVSENNSFGLSEEDVVKLATEHAARIYPGDRGDVAFAKMFSSADEAGTTLRAAVEVAKNASLQDAVTAEVEKDSRAACAELAKIGAERWPSLTKAQQFARAAETNPSLLNRAHRRPGPSTSFAHPVAKEQPTVLSVADIMPRTSTEEDVDDPAEALAQLRQLGRDRWPNESEAQQFLNAMTTAEYGDLIRRALGRPIESSPPRQS